MMDFLKVVYRSLLWAWKERSRYTFSLLLSIGGSFLSATVFYLNASFRNVPTEYDVDFVTYMASSVLLSAILMRVAIYPRAFKISLLGDPIGVMIGEISFGILYNLSLNIPPLLAYVLLGSRLKVGPWTLLLGLAVIYEILIFLFISLLDLLFPGSPVVSSVYNALNVLFSGLWFTPKALGPLLTLALFSPQFWIGELVRYSLLHKSLFSPILIILVLSTMSIASIIISKELVVEVGRRGGIY